MQTQIHFKAAAEYNFEGSLDDRIDGWSWSSTNYGQILAVMIGQQVQSPRLTKFVSTRFWGLPGVLIIDESDPDTRKWAWSCQSNRLPHSAHHRDGRVCASTGFTVLKEPEFPEESSSIWLPRDGIQALQHSLCRGYWCAASWQEGKSCSLSQKLVELAKQSTAYTASEELKTLKS